MSEIWDNPLIPVEDKLEICAGAYKWAMRCVDAQRTKKNSLQLRVEELEKQLVNKRTNLEAALLRIDKLQNALLAVVEWDLPETGMWNGEGTRRVSYEHAYGSNGAKRFIRDLASEALNDK